MSRHSRRSDRTGPAGSARLLSLLGALAAVAVLGVSLVHAAGEPDTGFGTAAVATPVIGSYDSAYDIATAPDGRLYVTGGVYGAYVARLWPSGQLDTSFAGTGYAAIASDWYPHLALQPDGKVLVVTRASSVGVVVHRFLSDGKPDLGFGNLGRFALGSLLGSPQGIGIQSDGRIVVVMRWASYPEGIGILRLTTAGQRDASFGTDGVAAFTSGTGLAITMAVAPDDGILVGGYLAGSVPYVMRFTPDGILDTAFGTGGTTTLSIPNGAQIDSLVALPGGDILAGGIRFAVTNLPDDRGWILARLDSGGDLDPTFGSGGIAEANPTAGADDLVDIAASGSWIYATGNASDDAIDLILGRFTTSGSLDNEFGTGGFTSVDLVNRRAGGQAIAVAPDSTVVVAGTAYDYSGFYRVTLARYVGDVQVSPALVDFGSIPQGVADAPVTVTVTNRGTSPVSIASVTLDGVNAADYSVTGESCTQQAIEISASCTVMLGFRPSAIGQRSARLVLSGPDPFGTRTRMVIGRGLDPVTLDKTAITYPNTVMTLTSAESTVTLRNIGAVPVTVSAVTLGGLNPGDFKTTGQTCTSAAIPVAGSCTVTVAFTPTTMGVRKATLTITGPSPVASRSISLTGTGLDQVVIKPASADFGNTTLWTSHSPIVVTLSNIGSKPVTPTGVGLSVPATSGFRVTSQTCTSIAVAGSKSCTVSVGFAPTIAGRRTATLIITGPAPIGTRTVAIAGTGVMPPNRITWGSTILAGPAYTWNSGGVLGRTVQSGVQRLHMAYATDRVGGRWTADGGPYVGVYYVRSTTGSTWTTPKRLNSTTQHAARLGLAAAGSRVYAIWVGQSKIYRATATTPRLLYVRVNTNHGSSTAWKTAVRLTSTTGRVDYPTVAAYGYDAHVVWTDAATGAIRIASSRDRGVTWKKLTLGTTTLADDWGRTGMPQVATAGSTVVVAWLADPAGTLKVRVSTNRGVTWGTTTTVGTGAAGAIGVAARGNRIAIAWTTPTKLVVRVRVAGTWRGPVVAASVMPSTAAAQLYAPAVVLQDPGRIGVAWSDDRGTSTRATLRWVESPDNGTNWYAPQDLATDWASASRRVNDWASVIWPAAGRRYVTWNGWTDASTNYRQFLRIGSGTAVGPTTVAPAWEPATNDRVPVAEGQVPRSDRKVAGPRTLTNDPPD